MDNKFLYLRWYIFPLFVFTFVLTFFENLWVFLASVVILLIFYFYFAFKYRNLLFLSIIFILASVSLGSYFLYNFLYYKDVSYSKGFVIKNFKIVWSYKKWQYVLEDDFWWNFIWKKFNKTYKLWDIIKIYWYLVPVSWNFQIWTKKFFSFNISLNRKIWDFDLDKFLKMKWYQGIVYVKHSYLIHHNKEDFLLKVKQDTLDRISQLYINYPEKYKWLVAWLLIWDKSFLNKSVYQEFIDSGLVHIIVVSGWNMVFLIIFLSVILFFIPFYVRLIVIMLFLCLYAALVWWDSSVIRALIMAILWILAIFYGQYVSTARLLWLAFLIMLLYNPYFLIYDLGFILSFLAILWILFFNKFAYKIGNDYYIPNFIHYKTTFKDFKKLTYTSFKEKLKYIALLSTLKFYNNYILPTFWATLFTSWAILFFTTKFNLISVFASILVVPIVPILMLINFLAILITYINMNIASWLIMLNIPLIKWVFIVANFISSNAIFIQWKI